MRTLESCPENATHWSSRGVAKASGLSVSTVQRIWRAFGLQPHRHKPVAETRVETIVHNAAYVCDGVYYMGGYSPIKESRQVQERWALSLHRRCSRHIDPGTAKAKDSHALDSRRFSVSGQS